MNSYSPGHIGLFFLKDAFIQIRLRKFLPGCLLFTLFNSADIKIPFKKTDKPLLLKGNAHARFPVKIMVVHVVSAALAPGKTHEQEKPSRFQNGTHQFPVFESPVRGQMVKKAAVIYQIILFRRKALFENITRLKINGHFFSCRKRPRIFNGVFSQIVRFGKSAVLRKADRVSPLSAAKFNRALYGMFSQKFNQKVIRRLIVDQKRRGLISLIIKRFPIDASRKVIQHRIKVF